MGAQMISNCVKAMIFLNSGKGASAKPIHANSGCVEELSSGAYAKSSATSICCRIESGAEASSSNSHSTAAVAATHAPMYAPYEQLGRNNNQTSCICGRKDVSDITVQCEVTFTTAPL